MENENPQNVTLQRPLQELSEGLHDLICIIAVRVVVLVWQNNLDLRVGSVDVIWIGTNTRKRNNVNAVQQAKT